MKLLFTYFLASLLVCYSASYAIQGQWTSDKYPNVFITVAGYTTNLDGTNVYQLLVNSCPFVYKIQIDQSCGTTLNLDQIKGTNNCSLVNSSKLAQEIEQKIFRFSINYKKLTFMSIFGNKTNLFTRSSKISTNDYLNGQYKDIVTGQTVIFRNKAVYLCNNNLEADFLTDNVNQFQLNISSVINNQCQSKGKNAQNVLQILGRATNYRVQMQNILTFYNQVKPSLRLKFVQKETQPTKNNNENKNNVSNSSKQSESGKSNSTSSSTPIKAPDAKDQSKNAIDTNNNKNSPTSSVSDSSTQNNQRSKGNQTSLNSASSQTKQNPASNTSSSTPSKTTQDSTTSSSGILKNETSSTSSIPIGREPYNGIEIKKENTIGTWNVEYFKNPLVENWPKKIRMNGTSLQLQGCNNISIPYKLNSTTQRFIASKNGIISTKNACPDFNKSSIDVVSQAKQFEPVRNSTSIMLNFYRNDELLWSMSRNLNQGQEVTTKNIAKPSSAKSTINNPVNDNQKNNSQADINTVLNNISILVIPSAQASPTSNNVPKSSQTKNSQAATTNTNPPTNSNSVQNSSLLLIGKYSLNSLYQQNFQGVLGQRYTYTFNTNSVSLVGTCNSYKYLYTLQQQGDNSVLSVYQQSKIQQKQNDSSCDPSKDALYLRILSQGITVQQSTNAGVSKLNILNSAGKVIAVLQKQLPK